MKSKSSLYIFISLFFIFISTSALSETVLTVSPNPGLAGGVSRMPGVSRTPGISRAPGITGISLDSNLLRGEVAEDDTGGTTTITVEFGGLPPPGGPSGGGRPPEAESGGRGDIEGLPTNGNGDNTPPTLELMSSEGVVNSSLPTTKLLTIQLKASGNNIDRIDVDWLGDGSDVSSLHATDSEIIEFTHVYSRSDLDGYFDNSVGFSRRIVTATATAYGNSEDIKSEKLSSNFTVYNYVEWLNSTILAPKSIEQGEELSIYVSKNSGVNVNIDNVYIRYRKQGAKKSKSVNNIGTWSPPVPFNKIATDYFYFYFPDTVEVSGTYEYQIKSIINNNIPELDINWSDIKTISFESTYGKGSIDTSGATSLTSEQLAIIENTRRLLKTNEKTIFDYLDDVEKVKYSVSYTILEVFKIVIDEKLDLDVDEIEDEIKQAIEEVDLDDIISKEEITSLMLDLAPYVGTGKSGIQLFSGYDIVTKEEISRFFEGASLSADTLSLGIGGRFVKLVKHSDKINKVSKIIPKIVHIVVKNRIIGKNAEILLKSKLANTYGSLEFGGTLITDYGRRFFDLVSADGLLAIESKVGRVSATKFTKKQILKDIESLRLENKDKIIWVFTESPTTGKSGWTSGLEKFKNEELEKLGFPKNSIEFKNSNLDPKSIATESIN